MKLCKTGVGGRVFNWIKDFLCGRKIQVRVGSDLSNQYAVENGTPQGSVISLSKLINSISNCDIHIQVFNAMIQIKQYK